MGNQLDLNKRGRLKAHSGHSMVRLFTWESPLAYQFVRREVSIVDMWLPISKESQHSKSFLSPRSRRPIEAQRLPIISSSE